VRRRCAREPGRVVGGGQQTPESALRAAAAARPTTRRFQSIPRDPHVMEAGTARLRGRPHRMLSTHGVLNCAAAWTRLGGPATTETAASLANMHCGGRGKLRLIQCVPSIVRNGAHLQTFRQVVDTDYRDGYPPLECSVRFDELPVCVRVRMCVGVFGYAVTCARA
jgi:hypothetical protein